MATRLIEFSADGRELYWFDSRGRDTAAVVAQDLESGATRVLAEDHRADFVQRLLDPITERPVAAAFVRARRVAGLWTSLLPLVDLADELDIGMGIDQWLNDLVPISLVDAVGPSPPS